MENNCSISSGYPNSVLQWCEYIEAYSLEYGVPKDLVAAVIYQESNGDKDAYSSSGAVGLMQVMPRDGLASSFTCGADNHPCFRDRPSMDELFDPEFNVNYGIRMLAGLYNTHGSWREALYRYGPINMGYYYADLVISHWQTMGSGK